MRNLQKILALVLALVMSLSLMATAGARDFTDGDQIDETFAESVDVLTGLEVFQGYPSGDFQPKGDITRAEVAAIIYRIATGDVTDSQVGIYADYNKFSDVPSDNWAAGYINYCANAEYIKGRGDGKFYPQDKVTGYEALAMILRVVGYDKNGEFTGADWQVQTAATANQRKVTKNVNAGTLGNPASRETVAELLCQAILIEKVNYTLAFGYQISTNPQDTIAYETFKMEKLEGVVTGNEYADLKETSPMAAKQTRLVIDGREEVLNISTDLDDIGMRVRVYIRPENGTTRSNLVTQNVYSEGLNRKYTTSDKTSVGNSTGSSEGITSIEGAEHFVNFDYANEWTAKIRITYDMKLRMSDYEARLLYDSNGGTLYTWDGTKDVAKITSGPDSTTDTIIRVPTGTYNYHYTKTIEAFKTLTDTDWDYLRNFIFAKANFNGTYVIGEVYVGTNDGAKKDVSDQIRWEDFVSAYLQGSENKAQISSNGQGNFLKIIDNDMDGIAEYVLQTIYTVAKVAPNGTGLDIAAMKLTDGDSVNEVSASDKITVVKGTNLETSEDTVAAGDVVIYAKIDGVVRAQKAEFETSRVTSINRSTAPRTATIESGEKKESWVHTHSDGLASYLHNMVIGTNYTVYFDLYGNIAAYTEGDVGQFVLITDGWYNQTVSGQEYAIQAYIDGALKTENITNNGSWFIAPQTAAYNNSWGNLKAFGGSTGALNGDNRTTKTTVATLENGNLVPVDKSYRYSQSVVMLATENNVIPTRDTNPNAAVYTTDYMAADKDAYNRANNGKTGNEYVTKAKVFGRSDTVYYLVQQSGLNPVTNQPNYVVRSYTGYGNVPSINPIYIEDVYAVGIETRANNGTTTPVINYTAEVVVVELNDKYQYMNNSEQVFIPSLSVVNNSVSRTAGYGVETITMIRGNGEVQDVQVDLSQSTVKYYDTAEGARRISGLYYMDPVDTNSSVYRIKAMEHEDIRANNYLTGYVNQSDGMLPTDYVRVDVQTVGIDVNGNSRPANSSLGTIGKTVGTENLYTLRYNSRGVATLTKAPATTVFDQYPDKGVSDTRAVGLNELWNNNNPASFNGTIGRNEVLVRYSGGSVVWAISFNEFSGGGSNNPDRDIAQDVWYENLVAADGTVTSGLRFFGVANNEPNRDQTNPDPKDADGNDIYTIKVPYAVANNTILDLTTYAKAATISNYTLTKWVASSSDYAQTIRQVDEVNETPANNPNGAKYKLVINFVSGGSEVYYLELMNQTKTFGVLASNSPEITVVRTTPNTETADKTGSAVITVADPEHTAIEELKDMLKTNKAGDRITKVVGYTSQGNPLSTDKENMVNNAAYLDVTVTNAGGLERVIRVTLAPVGTNPASYRSVKLPADVTLLVTYNDGSNKTFVGPCEAIFDTTSAASFYVEREGSGTLSINGSGNSINTTLGGSEGTSGKANGKTYGFLTLAVDGEITYTADPAVEAGFTSFKLNNFRVLDGAKITALDVANGTMTITVPNNTTVTQADANLSNWFGQSGAAGNYDGIVWTGDTTKGLTCVANITNGAGTMTITAPGLNSPDKTMTVTFVVNGSAAPRYIVHFNIGSTSGNVNIALQNKETGEYLTAEQYLSMGIATKTTFKVNGTEVKGLRGQQVESTYAFEDDQHNKVATWKIGTVPVGETSQVFVTNMHAWYQEDTGRIPTMDASFFGDNTARESNTFLEIAIEGFDIVGIRGLMDTCSASHT